MFSYSVTCRIDQPPLRKFNKFKSTQDQLLLKTAQFHGSDWSLINCSRQQGKTEVIKIQVTSDSSVNMPFYAEKEFVEEKRLNEMRRQELEVQLSWR